MEEISGSIIQSYAICDRQAWLAYHHIQGNRDNDLLLQGRIIHNNYYKKEKKEIAYKNSQFDIITTKDGKQIIVETKKSSKALDSAKLQLKYYLYLLYKEGIEVSGEIRIPVENKVIPVSFNDEDKENIENTINKINTLVHSDIPPTVKKRKFCKNCSYNLFCYS